MLRVSSEVGMRVWLSLTPMGNSSETAISYILRSQK
jgi:hypothetical protein